MANSRQQLALGWLQAVVGEGVQLEPLAGDASSRCYFRVRQHDRRWVLMDAPDQRQSLTSFIRIAGWLEQGGVRVPQLLASDLAQGLLLLEDLGDTTWSAALQQGAVVAPMMDDALEQLLGLQALDGDQAALPPFDRAKMRQECALYADWYLPYLRGAKMTDRERERFLLALEPLLTALVDQPQVAVHLDFHSRNLMVPATGLPLGVIDFQDARVGPVTYDIASLIYDCYQDYGEDQAQAWSRVFYQALPQRRRAAFASWQAWHQALLMTSLQRHIKVCGIFVRLAQRDGKQQFFSFLPQTRAHLLHELEALSAIALPLRPWLLDS